MKILFHHLAKTAGTSLIQSFIRRFRQRVCNARYDFELTPTMMTSDVYEFFHGHFSFDKVDEFRSLNPDSFIFTLVRNPVNRVISQYYNWIDEVRTQDEVRALAARGSVDPDYIKNKLKKFQTKIYGKSLEEFLDSRDPSVVDVCTNHQVRYLSHKATYRANNIEGLKEAYDNLERFYNFVGLTEYFDRAVPELCRGLNFTDGSLSAEITRNTNADKKVHGAYVISPEAWNKIVRQNTLDLSLFGFALGMFRARYRIDGAIGDDVGFPRVEGAAQEASNRE